MGRTQAGCQTSLMPSQYTGSCWPHARRRMPALTRQVCVVGQIRSSKYADNMMFMSRIYQEGVRASESGRTPARDLHREVFPSLNGPSWNVILPTSRARLKMPMTGLCWRRDKQVAEETLGPNAVQNHPRGTGAMIRRTCWSQILRRRRTRGGGKRNRKEKEDLSSFTESVSIPMMIIVVVTLN